MNRPKIDMRSQRIVLKKIEQALFAILESLESKEQPGMLTFENLGLFFVSMGLFKALKFRHDENNNETSLFLSEKSKIDVQRLKSEMIFHE